MARKLRTSPAGIPQLIQRLGKKGVKPFRDDTDRLTYLDYLGRYAVRYQVAMHAWCAGADSIIFLCTPASGDAISQMLQATGRLYAQYYNQRHDTHGGIWQDRYKSALVLDDDMLLDVYRFIEQLPVNEQLCDQPEQYAWSSAGSNALGMPHSMASTHSAFERLAKTPEARRDVYLQQLHQPVDSEKQIRKSLKMGLAMGDPGFIRRIEQVTGRRLTEGKRGRPRKVSNLTES